MIFPTIPTPVIPPPSWLAKISSTDPTQHWFWTAPRHVLNASGTAASKRLLPNGAPRPYMRIQGSTAYKTAYRPKPRPIEPSVWMDRRTMPLYRALVIHFRGHEFPTLNLHRASTPKHADGAPVLGKDRIKLIRCPHRHPDYGQCCNPFCVHSPVPFSALQEPTIPPPTADEVRDDILAYTLRREVPDMNHLFTSWEEVGVPNAVIREVISDPDFRLDTDRPWREAIKAWLGIPPALAWP
jgi:hypothetical protein